MAENRAEGGDGWKVLYSTVDAARQRFRTRLRVAYALGSLAHGGFAPLVSDVDVALVFSDSAVSTRPQWPT